MKITHGLSSALASLVDRFVTAVEIFVAHRINANRVSGGMIVFIVKDDNPDVNYSITAPSVTDAEGNVIPDAQLSYEISSTDANVVAITPDAADPKAGSVHFGAPGDASINVNITNGTTVLGAFGAQFHVTTGDPAAISGGSIAFDGLTES